MGLVDCLGFSVHVAVKPLVFLVLLLLAGLLLLVGPSPQVVCCPLALSLLAIVRNTRRYKPGIALLCSSQQSDSSPKLVMVCYNEPGASLSFRARAKDGVTIDYGIGMLFRNGTQKRVVGVCWTFGLWASTFQWSLCVSQHANRIERCANERDLRDSRMRETSVEEP